MEWNHLNNNWEYHPELSFLLDGFNKNDKNNDFELIACDNNRAFVRCNNGEKNLVKQYDIKTGMCNRTIRANSNMIHFSFCQNIVLICDYVKIKEDKIGNSTIKVIDLENKNHTIIKEIKDYKVEAIWLCGDSVIVIGTNEDFGHYVFSPYTQAYMMNRVEEEYLKDMHKTFTVYNLDFTSKKRKSLKKEININCGAIAKSIFFFTLIDSCALYGYDTKTKKIKKYTQLHGRIKALIGNNNKIIAYCDNDTFEMYDVNTFQLTIIEKVPNQIYKLLTNASLLFAVLDRAINVYDITSCQLITTITLPSCIFPNGVMVNDNYIFWQIGRGLVVKDCPLSLQEMINKQIKRIEGEKIPIEERKKYFLD